LRQRPYDFGMGAGAKSRRASALSARALPVPFPVASRHHPRIVHATHQAREWQSVRRPKRTTTMQPQSLQYPLRDSNSTADFDRTRLYGHPNSSLDFPHMEVRRWPVHELDPEHCVPIASWQSHFYPVCNEIHEHSFQEGLAGNLTTSSSRSGADMQGSEQLEMLSSKGFWRLAWKLDQQPSRDAVTTSVWRTFKYVRSDCWRVNRRTVGTSCSDACLFPSCISSHSILFRSG
jgi:hypothetical protein